MNNRLSNRRLTFIRALAAAKLLRCLSELSRLAIVAVIQITFIANLAAAADRFVLDPVHDPELGKVLSSSFTLPLLGNIEGQTEADLSSAINAEVNKLTGVLYSLGYLDARVETSGGASPNDPFRLVPIPGQIYRIGWIRVDGLPSPTPTPLARALNGFIAEKVGESATQSILRDIARGILFEVQEASYGMAAVGSSEIELETGTRTAGVVVTVQAGASLQFGDVQFSGSYRIGDAEAQELVPFSPGDAYSATAVDALRSSLEQSTLFRRVRIELVENAGDSGIVDLIVELRDKPPDPQTLDESAGVGPARLMITMLMIVLLESVRVTHFWSYVAVRVALTSTVLFMLSVSGLMILNRLLGFLL